MRSPAAGCRTAADAALPSAGVFLVEVAVRTGLLDLPGHGLVVYRLAGASLRLLGPPEVDGPSLARPPVVRPLRVGRALVPLRGRSTGLPPLRRSRLPVLAPLLVSRSLVSALLVPV